MNYLYNGVELPDINEVWTDKETYPYAVISPLIYVEEYDCSIAEGMLCNVKPYYKNSVGSVKIDAPYKCIHIVYLDNEKFCEQNGMIPNEWNAEEEEDNTVGNSIGYSQVLWTSHDILNEDGTVYLEASEPVPVDDEDDEILRIYKSTISGIADKIREKTGKTEKFPFTKEAVSQELDAINIGETSYVVSEPVEFTLSADKWNGTTYTLSLTGYDNTHEPQLGLPLISSSINTEQVVKSALTIPQVTVQKNSNTGQITNFTIYISAITTPTIDINVAIFGIKAQEVTA